MLPKARRLSSSAFASASRGTFYHAAHFTLKVSRVSDSIPSRFACVVSKKIDTRAVKRNVVRRRCMNCLRPKIASLPAGLICIFSAKKGVLELSYKDFDLEISSLLAKAFNKNLVK